MRKLVGELHCDTVPFLPWIPALVPAAPSLGRDTRHVGVAQPLARRSLPRSRSQLRFFSVWRLS